MSTKIKKSKLQRGSSTQNESSKRTRREHAVQSLTTTECNVPSGFVCPLTMEVMFDPVLDAEGNTFERMSLLQWLKQSPTSPISRQPLSERMVTSNNALRESIHEFMGVEWIAQRQQAMETVMKSGSGECTTTTNNSNNNNCTTTGKEISRARAKIDCFLRNTSKEIGDLELKLNADGCCAFRYDTITIVLDVPDHVGVLCLYTKDFIHGISHLDQDLLCRRAMELNFLQGETRGGCLSVRTTEAGKEIMFSYTDRVAEVSARDFTNIFLNFVETTVRLRDKLLRGLIQRQWWEDNAEDEQPEKVSILSE
jgi:U-box domain/Tir chaperone protein (CesT) family